MKIFPLITICGLLIISCNQSPKQSATTETDTIQVSSQDSARDGIFIHITESYNDPHRVLMPLKMANMMAEDKDVIVYMDIHAVELVSERS